MRQLAFPASVAVLVVAQAALIAHFEPPALIFAADPVSGLDVDTHAEQAWRVAEALDGWGRSWAYDVQLLAGYPNGTVFDADNKGWELTTWALWKAGLPMGTAFNLFILLAHVLLPWVVFASARMFGLGRWASLAAAGLAMGLWYFDSFPHRCWWIGMVSYAFAGYLLLLPMALAYRYIEEGGWWRATALGAVLAAGHLVHPYTFMMVAGPMAVMYARSARTMGWRRHAGLWGAAAFTVAANVWWIAVALGFWHYVLDSGFFGQSTLVYALADWLGLQIDPEITGFMANRTAMRPLLFGAAVATLVAWGRRGDRRMLPFAVGIGLMLGMTYLGGYFWFTRQVQPYRYILPAIYLAVIPAAAFIEEIARDAAGMRMPRSVKAAIAIIAVVALPYLARDVLYFIPGLVPGETGRSAVAPASEDMFGSGWPGAAGTKEYRREATDPEFVKIAHWVSNRDDGQGRWLVDLGFLGEYLVHRTGAQVLGGFRKRNMVHTAANLLRRYPQDTDASKHLAGYLEQYAVRWVVISRRMPLTEGRTDLIEPVAWFPPHRIYESKLPVTFFEKGSGKVEASLNRIEVSDTPQNDDIVIRFHWLETLVCEPGCRIERSPVDGDPVGFIRIPAPHPTDMVVSNGY